MWNQPAPTPLDGVGAWMATANDPTAAAGQVAPQYLYGHSFRFADSTASGVVGLATGGAGKLAVFSAAGPDGTAYNTGIAFNWVAGGFYFPLVYRAAPGVWGASIYDYTAGTWTAIGVLHLPSGWGKLAPSSTTMAVWYGPSAASCSAYPRADVSSSPPRGLCRLDRNDRPVGDDRHPAGRLYGRDLRRRRRLGSLPPGNLMRR